VKTKEPIWIDEHAVLAIHDSLLATHGGKTGLRDNGLLESALARPKQHKAYSESPCILEMATLYTDGIIRNHPFADGNKRTGFVTGVLFLELTGFEFNASEEDATQAVISLAAGALDEAGYTAWLRSNTKPRKRR
jgi:death-on-curing protein